MYMILSFKTVQIFQYNYKGLESDYGLVILMKQ
jgi:hypothetical protein